MFKTIKTAEQVATEKQQHENENRIAKLKLLLIESDYKVLPDYDKQSDDIKTQRQAWRDEIRMLENL